MKEEQALKLMAEVGPGAVKALDSWVSLQWAYYWAHFLTGVVAAGVLVFWAYCVYRGSKVNKEVSK